MKNKGLMYLCVVIIIIVSTIIAIKYDSLKQAYHKAEKEKVDYCTKYYEEKGRVECFMYEIQYKDSVINQINGFGENVVEQDTPIYYLPRIRIYYPDDTDTIIEIQGWDVLFGFTTDVNDMILKRNITIYW
jgi:hypothetical protein